MPSDGQTLAALGAARVDDGAAATGLHANQKTVGTGAAGLGGLVSAFHDDFSGEPAIIADIPASDNPGVTARPFTTVGAMWISF
jgi:hypothetical protein